MVTENKQTLFWVIDVGTLLDNEVFTTITGLLKQFNLNRSDILPTLFSLVDMINVHLNQQEGETLIHWLDNECKIICYQLINTRFCIDDTPEDLHGYLYLQQERLVCLLMSWVIALVAILPDYTKEIYYISFTRGWVVNTLVRQVIPKEVNNDTPSSIDFGYPTI